jgi:hypothetical protein
MPRAVTNAAKTVEAVNGPEVDRMTPGFEDAEDGELTQEHEGRYRIVTPRAVSFTAYGVRFVEGIGRTDDLELAQRLKAEFSYKVVDSQRPGQRVPMPEPIPEFPPQT